MNPSLTWKIIRIGQWIAKILLIVHSWLSDCRTVCFGWNFQLIQPMIRRRCAECGYWVANRIAGIRCRYCYELIYYIHVLEIYSNWHHWLRHTRRISKIDAEQSAAWAEWARRGRMGHFPGKYPFAIIRATRSASILFIGKSKANQERISDQKSNYFFAICCCCWRSFPIAFHMVYSYAKKKSKRDRICVWRAHGILILSEKKGNDVKDVDDGDDDEDDDEDAG